MTPSPQAPQGKSFRGALTLVPIRLLRQPDRWVRRKPWQAEQASSFSTSVCCKTQQRTCVTRNATVSCATANRVTRDKCIRSCVNAPPKPLGSKLPAPLDRRANGRRQKLSIALALREATTVFSAASIPGHRNKRIRRCSNAPLKKRL